MTAVASVKEPHLRALLDSFFSDKDFVAEYRKLPSAMVHHHNYLGGNLEHVVAVLDICEALCEVYKELEPGKSVQGAAWADRAAAEAEVEADPEPVYDPFSIGGGTDAG
jgi:23S rRNA maturation-related 3'-5' exoribonuclease YhaM